VKTIHGLFIWLKSFSFPNKGNYVFLFWIIILLLLNVAASPRLSHIVSVSPLCPVF